MSTVYLSQHVYYLRYITLLVGSFEYLLYVFRGCNTPKGISPDMVMLFKMKQEQGERQERMRREERAEERATFDKIRQADINYQDQEKVAQQKLCVLYFNFRGTFSE